MKDFNNTFISTEHLTPEQLTSLYSKYKEVLEKSGRSVTGNKTSKTDKLLCCWGYLYVRDSYMSYTDNHFFLSQKCKLKQITEEDLDNYLKEQDGVTKYEKVEGMEVGQIVQLMSEGVEFYRHKAGNLLIIDTSRIGIFIGKNTASMDLGFLRMELNDGNIYRKLEETPWYDKHKGSLVAVKDYGDKTWKYDVFEEYNDWAARPFKCKYATWKEMRPLTQVERFYHR